MRRALLAAALVLAGATAACSSASDAEEAPPASLPLVTSEAAPEVAPSAAAPSPSAVDACALVTKAEAEKLAGLALQDAVPSPQSCAYTAPPTGTTGQVEVYIGDGAKKQYDIELQLGHELTPFSGAGDEAYIYVDGLTVYVNKGGVWASLHLVRLDEPAKYRAALEDLARTMSTRY